MLGFSTVVNTLVLAHFKNNKAMEDKVFGHYLIMRFP